MISDKILMIPILSKELTLIGHSSLPFKLQKSKKNKAANEASDEAFKIVFDSKVMVESLTSVCLELVKQIKLFGEKDDDELHKINFANIKLEKQLKVCKSEMDKTENALAAEKELNRQLGEKVSYLQQQVKSLETNCKKLAQKSQTSEDLLKHSLKKKESELLELHKILWKQFNMVDDNSFPSNFTIVQPDQPDFSRLWSEVKYSDIKTKEYLLKQAVGVFQKNNIILTEDNVVLKTFLVTFLQDMNEVQKLMFQKMHLPDKLFFDYKIEDVCPDRRTINLPVCKNILSEFLNLLKKICVQFDEATFSVGDDVFVCWSDIISKLLDV